MSEAEESPETEAYEQDLFNFPHIQESPLEPAAIPHDEFESFIVTYKLHEHVLTAAAWADLVATVQNAQGHGFDKYVLGVSVTNFSDAVADWADKATETYLDGVGQSKRKWVADCVLLTGATWCLSPEDDKQYAGAIAFLGKSEKDACAAIEPCVHDIAQILGGKPHTVHGRPLVSSRPHVSNRRLGQLREILTKFETAVAGVHAMFDKDSISAAWDFIPAYTDLALELASFLDTCAAKMYDRQTARAVDLNAIKKALEEPYKDLLDNVDTFCDALAGRLQDGIRGAGDLTAPNPHNVGGDFAKQIKTAKDMRAHTVAEIDGNLDKLENRGSRATYKRRATVEVLAGRNDDGADADASVDPGDSASDGSGGRARMGTDARNQEIIGAFREQQNRKKSTAAKRRDSEADNWDYSTDEEPEEEEREEEEREEEEREAATPQPPSDGHVPRPRRLPSEQEFVDSADNWSRIFLANVVDGPVRLRIVSENDRAIAGVVNPIEFHKKYDQIAQYWAGKKFNDLMLTLKRESGIRRLRSKLPGSSSVRIGKILVKGLRNDTTEAFVDDWVQRMYPSHTPKISWQPGHVDQPLFGSGGGS